MKRRIKPVTKIKDLPFPHLGWVNNLEGRGPLHIANRRGEQDGLSVSITHCGRAIRFQHYIGNGIIKDKPTSIEELQTTFRLCTRCGDVGKFAASLELWRRGYARQAEEYRERRAQEDTEREQEAKVYRARLERLQAALPFPIVEDHVYGWAFIFEGFKYHVQQDKAVDS